MIKRIERNSKSAALIAPPSHIHMHIPTPNPLCSGPAQAFLSLPLPLPDYRRRPRWPKRDARRPEAVLYFVDYTVPGPGQPPEESGNIIWRVL